MRNAATVQVALVTCIMFNKQTAAGSVHSYESAVKIMRESAIDIQTRLKCIKVSDLQRCTFRLIT